MIHRVTLIDGTAHDECAGFRVVAAGQIGQAALPAVMDFDAEGVARELASAQPEIPTVPRTIRFLTATGAVEVAEDTIAEIAPPLEPGEMTERPA